MADLEEFFSDLHIHSAYSKATSPEMRIENISRIARMKGLDLIGTGDCLNQKWIEEIKSKLEVSGEEIRDPKYGVNYILTVEVEDINRVHHLIILPEISSAQSMAEEFGSSDEGRPKVKMGAPEIVEIVKEFEGEIGPSHAFTPWTSVYKEFNSLRDCYQEELRNVNFVELGLSASTEMADRISELSRFTFLSNSDAHSPKADKLGREFNSFLIEEPTFKEVSMAIKRKNKRKVGLNFGLDPRIGKYFLTACVRCHKRYSKEEAESMNWKCKCGGRIKKGVKDRIDELADLTNPRSPKHRPPYIGGVPLIEAISFLEGKSLSSRVVYTKWMEILEKFGSEIEILVKADLSELSSLGKLSKLIDDMRRGKLKVFPGGGGEYGKLL